MRPESGQTGNHHSRRFRATIAARAERPAGKSPEKWGREIRIYGPESHQFGRYFDAGDRFAFASYSRRCASCSAKVGTCMILRMASDATLRS